MKVQMKELLKLTNSEGDMVIVDKGSQAHEDWVAKGFADKKAESAPKTTRKPRARKKASEEVTGDE